MESLMFTLQLEKTNSFVYLKRTVLLLGEGNGNSFSDGHFGLWVDDELYLGHSDPCLTFSNEVLCEGDFVITALEVWGFTL
jgi:hypothetical protein